MLQIALVGMYKCLYVSLIGHLNHALFFVLITLKTRK